MIRDKERIMVRRRLELTFFGLTEGKAWALVVMDKPPVLPESPVIPKEFPG